CVLQRGIGVVNRARTDDDEQPRVFAGQDALNGGAAVGHRSGADCLQGNVCFDLGRRGHVLQAGDIEVIERGATHKLTSSLSGGTGPRDKVTAAIDSAPTVPGEPPLPAVCPVSGPRCAGDRVKPRATVRRAAMVSIRGSVSAAVWSAVAVLASTTAILAQDPAPRPVFRAGVDVIEVDVQVIGRDGAPVLDLQPEQFDVRIGGQRRRVASAQMIRYGDASLVASAPASAA